MHSPETRIDVLHLEDLRNPIHPSIFDENEAYDLFIFRIPLPGETLDIRSVGFVITKEDALLYDREHKTFQTLEGRFDGLYRVADRYTDLLLKSFQRYPERVADMEEALYEDTHGATFMTDWLELKRDLLRIERVLARTTDVLQSLIEAYETLGDAFPVNHYVDLHEHLDRTMRSAGLQLSKLDYLYNFYNARTNEKMNRLIYALTIISAIFLPLNLVVGFFGMNTGGLPFAQSSFGTVQAVLLMLSLVLLTSLVMLVWKKRTEKG